MEIPREHYLHALRNRMHNGMVKIITGLRRSGKSYLLFRLFRNELLAKGVSEDHIISLSMDGLENRKYRDPYVAYQYITERMKDNGDYYILLDEVQMMQNFEEVLNSMLHRENADVYVTGSNSKFLSTDVITEFRGRGDEVHVYPLTFSELMQVYDGSPEKGWDAYVNFGGLPRTITMATDAERVAYLSRLFGETYLRDIIEHNHLQKTQEAEELLRVLASSIGALVSPQKIHATFQSKLHTALSMNTIHQYIDIFSDAFLLNEAQRYDVKGRKYIGSPVKYYFEDIGLRNACLGFRQVEETHTMENIIYNELRYRGWSVDVGTVRDRRRQADGSLKSRTLEVDFVANLGARRVYIQSAYRMPDEEKLRQEKASLLALPDSFPKFIIVHEPIRPRHDDNGITMISLFDFLLHKENVI